MSYERKSMSEILNALAAKREKEYSFEPEEKVVPAPTQVSICQRCGTRFDQDSCPYCAPPRCQWCNGTGIIQDNFERKRRVCPYCQAQAKLEAQFQVQRAYNQKRDEWNYQQEAEWKRRGLSESESINIMKMEEQRMMEIMRRQAEADAFAERSRYPIRPLGDELRRPEDFRQLPKPQKVETKPSIPEKPIDKFDPLKPAKRAIDWK